MDKKWKEVLEASNNELKSKLKAEITVMECVDRYDNPAGLYNISVRKKNGAALYFVKSAPENMLCYFIEQSVKATLDRMRRYIVSNVYTSTLPDCILTDGDTVVEVFDKIEDAKKCFKEFVDAEIDYRDSNEDKYEIAQNDEFSFQINWCGGDCKVFVKIHEIYV